MKSLCLLALAAALAGCGRRDVETTDPGAWQARADERYSSANRMDSDPLRSEPYAKAAFFYRNAFRLEDPVPDRADARALLAFRTARALARSARANPVHQWSELRAKDALFWLDRAMGINTGMRQVWFERARIYESPPEGVRDFARARGAYQRYVASLEGVEPVPASEVERIQHARRRIEELAAEIDDG